MTKLTFRKEFPTIARSIAYIFSENTIIFVNCIINAHFDSSIRRWNADIMQLSKHNACSAKVVSTFVIDTLCHSKYTL